MNFPQRIKYKYLQSSYKPSNKSKKKSDKGFFDEIEGFLGKEKDKKDNDDK